MIDLDTLKAGLLADARLESGKALPSLRAMIRYAKATGSRAVVKIEACE